MHLKIKIEIKMEIQTFGDDASAAVTPQPTPSGEAVPTTSTVPGPMLKLGEINALLSPLSLSAECLSHLGFEPAGREKAAKLYRASDFPAICSALLEHIQGRNAKERGLQSQGELADALSEAINDPEARKAKLESMQKALQSGAAHWDYDCEAKWAEQEKHLNCPACGGSGHVDDVRPVGDNLIRSVFLSNGFTIKEGQTDLKPYVFDAARALIAAATQDVQPCNASHLERFRPTMTGDILKSWEKDAQVLIDQQRAVIDGLVEALKAVQFVSSNSSGISGWHLNGDIADWDELLPEVFEAITRYEADKSQVQQANPKREPYPDTHTKFRHGQQVAKPKGARWSGVVCGWYSTELTQEGYCVASTEPGSLHSVQVYPASALFLDEGCGACGDACASRGGVCRLAEESPMELNPVPPLGDDGRFPFGWKLHKCPDGKQCRDKIAGGCALGWCSHFGIKCEQGGSA